MNKTERDELRRLLRARFKVLRADVEARRGELEAELSDQITAHFAAIDKQYDDAMYRIKLIGDDANRQINDIGRELHGADKWGVKHDRAMFSVASPPKPGSEERVSMSRRGFREIEQRVRNALLTLDRQENELLTELAMSALESADAQVFFGRIPSVSELVPAYRLHQIAGDD